MCVLTHTHTHTHTHKCIYVYINEGLLYCDRGTRNVTQIRRGWDALGEQH